MAKGRAKQNVKVENMLDGHVMFALEVLDAVLGGKTDDARNIVKGAGIETAKLRGRSSVCKRRAETRIANRLSGPKVKDNLEDLL